MELLQVVPICARVHGEGRKRPDSSEFIWLRAFSDAARFVVLIALSSKP